MKRGLRVLVCGGRSYDDREFVCIVLDRIHRETPIEAVIHGAAPGADTLARLWAIENKVTNIDHPADWRTHGRAAGPIRNQEMIDISEPDVVVAFPGGVGTADMVRRARKAGIPVEHAARDAKDAANALRDELRTAKAKDGQGGGESP